MAPGISPALALRRSDSGFIRRNWAACSSLRNISLFPSLPDEHGVEATSPAVKQLAPRRVVRGDFLLVCFLRLHDCDISESVKWVESLQERQCWLVPAPPACGHRAVSLESGESQAHPFPGDARAGSSPAADSGNCLTICFDDEEHDGHPAGRQQAGVYATPRGIRRRERTQSSPSGLSASFWAQLRRIEMSAIDGAIAAPCAVFLRHGA